jgi:6-pyruvoyltetrahydropterin/6-carboxytetrahydropterin synthase
MKQFVSVRVHFNAAHRLFNPSFSDARNEEIFGVCNNPNFHGHNYEMDVTVQGTPHPDTGMIMDVAVLKKIVEREVVAVLDHKNLNLDVDFLKSVIPTAENIAAACWKRLEGKLPAGRLYEIRLYETPRNVAICRSE